VAHAKQGAGAETIPSELLRIVDADGIFPLLEKEGLIAPRF
jgi:hypothetical protein